MIMKRRTRHQKRTRLVDFIFYPGKFSNNASWSLENKGRPMVHPMRERIGLSHLVTRRKWFIDALRYRMLKGQA